jgi:hypothetical protein
MFATLRNAFVLPALLVSGLAAQSSGYAFWSLGNRWLGADVYATASVSRTSSALGMTTADARAYVNIDGKLLTAVRTIAQFDAAAHNERGYVWVNQGGFYTRQFQQRASASLRIKLAGVTVWDRSVTTTGDLGGIPQRTLNLFPVDPRADVGIGPFTVTLAGNVGVTFGAGAIVTLPTNDAAVGLLASANTAALGRASVAVGVLGFGAGVELQGRFAETRLTGGVNASSNGLSGFMSIELRAVSLRLIAFLTAAGFRVYSTTLTSWGTPAQVVDLISL